MCPSHGHDVVHIPVNLSSTDTIQHHLQQTQTVHHASLLEQLSSIRRLNKVPCRLNAHCEDTGASVLEQQSSNSRALPRDDSINSSVHNSSLHL